MSVRSLVIVAACGVSLLSGVGFAAEDRVDYLTQIKPVLRERCYACHGALKQEGGLRLDTAALAVKGGDSGAAVQPGDAAASLLLQRISASDESERMPPEGESLTADQVAALRNWISQKATAPADEVAERDPRDHWAFRTPVRPAVPELKPLAGQPSRWRGNPIDALIARAHQKHGLTPQPVADKRVWLRRVSIDLVGLPPTPEELAAFVGDESAEAHDKVVARLLDSPQYGQRWGRHWMDIWRYSDWWGLGAEVRNSQKHIWHWRDWIVESVNADKGYDQMLREMLAADELYPNDLDRLRATGFLARQYFIFNRTTWLDETVEHSAKAMLGLTFNCAKCHDHKYDPFSQVEYYQMRSLFEPYQVRTEMVPGQIDFEKDGIPRAFDAHLDVPTFLHIRGDDRNPDKSRTIEPAAPAFLSSDNLKLMIEPVSLPLEATHPGLRPFVVEAYRKAAEQQIASARAALETAGKTLRKSEAAAKELAAKTLAAKEAAATNDSAEKAATEAAAKVKEGGPDAGKPSNVIVRDDFSTAKPDVWEQLTGKWSYENGRLVQSQVGSIRGVVRLKQLPPADFEARVKYIPTGGDQWKSVGISCDVTAEGNELLAYLSAVASGPRSQIAFKQGAAYVYPSAAAQPRKVKLNQPHEIVLRARGTLLNMSVDGEHSIAFRLPTTLQRQRGHLELITFDATVEFVEFELKALPPELKLVEADAPEEKPAVVASASLPIDQAKLGVTIAKKSLMTAEARLVSLEARGTADQLRHRGSPSGEVATGEAEPAEKSDAESAASQDAAIAAKKSELILAALKSDEALSRAELALLKSATDKKPAAEKTFDAAKTALEKARKAVETPDAAYTPLPGAKKTQEDYQNRNAGKPFPPTSSGRRSALAKWLTDPRHPLPARVAVNHIWMRHMGQPLVPTVFDFGRKGTPPTHPELLDWLAVELIENNWSMKHIHRLIVTSETYRLSSSSAAATEATLASDPDNRFFWRMNPVRMEAQIVRDSLLHIAGELDLSSGGPSIPVSDQASRRRSLYFVHSHNDHQKFLSMFDDASVLDCYRRAESIVPQQALALENSPLAAAMAGKIAERITAANPSTSDGQFIRIAFLTVLSAEPNAAEQALISELLPSLTAAARLKKRPDPESSARVAVIHALLNHNDFVTVR